jgi:hypothetical protein
MDRQRKANRSGEEAEVLHQVSGLLRQVCGLDVRTDIAHGKLETASPANAGVLAITGVQREDVLELTCWLLDIPHRAPLPADALFRELQSLGEGGIPLHFVSRTHPEKSGHLLLGVTLHIDMQRPSLSRMARLRDVFTRLESCGTTLQELLPTPRDNSELLRRYEGFGDHLQPIFPIDNSVPAPPDPHRVLVYRMLQHLQAGLPCFLVSPSTLRSRIFLSFLARESRDEGGPTIATVRDIVLPPHNLLQLVLQLEHRTRGAGAIVVPLTTLLPGPEVRPLLFPALQALTSSGHPVIIQLSPHQRAQLEVVTEVQEEMRSLTIVPPSFPADIMQHFAARLATDERDGCSAKDFSALRVRMQGALEGCTAEEIERLALPVARRESALLKSPGDTTMSTSAFIASLEDTMIQTHKKR